jgi:hypothetical protein
VSPVSFEIIGGGAVDHAAVPTIVLRLRITSNDGGAIHAIALRCQIMIEPNRRPYAVAEQPRLVDLFGDTPRWGDTLRPFLWVNVSLTVPGFVDSTEVDLTIPCTYDFEVVSAKYLHALEDGEIPLLALFSGTVFNRTAAGFNAMPVSWSEEAAYRLPVSVWRDTMDLYFPQSGWIRVRRETLDALQHYRVSTAMVSWDDTLATLLEQVGEDA